MEDPSTVNSGVSSSVAGQIECAICLQSSVFPVQLPCKHVFCYLCVKGVTLQSKRCAMCRREIPEDYLFNPDLVNQSVDELVADEQVWYYEGRNGWWQYDQRTCIEIEAQHKAGATRCELLIAGFLYIIDFEHMLQYRRNDPSRQRKVKRDVASRPKKGVAGLRIGVQTRSHSTDDRSGSNNTTERQGLNGPNDHTRSSSVSDRPGSSLTSDRQVSNSRSRSDQVGPRSTERGGTSSELAPAVSGEGSGILDVGEQSSDHGLGPRITLQGLENVGQVSSELEQLSAQLTDVRISDPESAGDYDC